MENPVTAPWGLVISRADFAKLKHGVRPRDMDDRWFFKDMTDEELTKEATSNGVKKDEAPPNGATEDECVDLTDEEVLAELDIDELLMDEALRPVIYETTTVDLDRGGNISIRRSWTNKELYRLIVKPIEGGTSARVEAITWEQYQGDHISEEQAKIDAVILCRNIIGCDFADAPDYEPELFSSLRGISLDQRVGSHGGADGYVD